LTKRGTKKALGEGSERTQEDADLSLEERLRRLDEIVAALEGGDVELERGLKLFEEGVRHIREAESLLSTAEMRVEELVGDAEAATTKPLESDQG
jgi:exodeoxyribonuclease VII small subunit